MAQLLDFLLGLPHHPGLSSTCNMQAPCWLLLTVAPLTCKHVLDLPVGFSVSRSRGARHFGLPATYFLYNQNTTWFVCQALLQKWADFCLGELIRDSNKSSCPRKAHVQSSGLEEKLLSACRLVPCLHFPHDRHSAQTKSLKLPTGHCGHKASALPKW